MTSTTAAQLGPELLKSILDQLLASMNETKNQMARAVWDVLMTNLAEHWVFVSIILFSALTVAFISALLGRWGSFGSLLYNYLYFGILFVIGLIWGPEALFGDLVSILRTALIWPVCYFLVGVILRKFEFIK